MYIYSAVFRPRFPVALTVGGSLPALAALLRDGLPALVVFGASEAPSPSSFTFGTAFFAFGLLAGATFEVGGSEVESSFSFFGFFGGLASFKKKIIIIQSFDRILMLWFCFPFVGMILFIYWIQLSSHTLSYGPSVFCGLRCVALPLRGSLHVSFPQSQNTTSPP